MTRNSESPQITDVASGAGSARSWSGRVRFFFGKPHATSMPGEYDPAVISKPSQPVTSLLGTIPSLRFATSERLQELADVTHREAVAAGETIIRQGDYGKDLFFILDGSVEVLISHFGEAPDFIRELHAGDSFGELGVLYDVPRTATIRCTAAGHVLRIPGRAFLDALDTGS